MRADDVYALLNAKIRKLNETVEEINNYGYRSSLELDAFFERYMELNRPDTVYTVKFPLWTTAQLCIGEKLDDNAGMLCEPSTDKVRSRDDYAQRQEWKVWDVNAEIDDNGERHITAMEGDEKFKRRGKTDVFVAGMSYYEKTWIEGGYWYYSRRYRRKDGYTLCQAARNRDGSMAQVALYAKYPTVLIDGIPYSSEGEKIWRNGPSYNNSVVYTKKKGKFYSGALLADYFHSISNFWIKYATTNSQSIMRGCTNYDFQYKAAAAETNVRRVIVTKAQAESLVPGSCVSVGDAGGNTNLDRSNGYMHNIADNVKILYIEAADENNSAVYLDISSDITTTETTYISTMHWMTGSTDGVLGNDGSPNSNTNGKNPCKIQGIELFNGGYEIPGNAIMNILTAEGGEPQREVYVTNDASLVTTDVGKIKSTYHKLEKTIPYTNARWQYITEIFIDLINGAVIPTAAGQTGSSSESGFADGLYTDTNTTGQKELILLGYLGVGGIAGLLFLMASLGLEHIGWIFLFRISINGTGGEGA